MKIPKVLFIVEGGGVLYTQTLQSQSYTLHGAVPNLTFITFL